MANSTKNPPAGSHWDSEVRLLAWLATCIAVFSYLFYFRNGDTALYGDAVAHINIARRVFDSRTPGLLQLGTVWLPLPHLLMIPFLISNEMWQRGVGGSIPSLTAYVCGVIGIFRLARGVLSQNSQPDAGARIAAWAAALIYAANPNLIYMQTTAMGEAIYLALFIWTVVYFSEWLRGSTRALNKCAACLAAACLTRYDGWFLAAGLSLVVIVLALRPPLQNQSPGFRLSRRVAITFVLIAATAPALWLAYNAIIYRNPLEFENGPYSAKAIEMRTENPRHSGHPGSGSLGVSSLYFFKAAQETMADGELLEHVLVIWFVAGCLGMLVLRKVHVFALLLAPIAFYAFSIGYGGVPIFVPAWWPFTHYNVRYGLQLLPAFALAFAVVMYLGIKLPWPSGGWLRTVRWAAIAGTVALVTVGYASIWRATPITLAEAQINMRSRNQLEAQLAGWLSKLPPDSTILMYLGDHVGALEQAGVPLRRTINEGNHRVWKQPEDAEGLWERALSNPAAYAGYVVAFEGDPVWQAVQNRHLRALVEIHVTGQSRAVLYRIR